jgi:hypothetical protein
MEKLPMNRLSASVVLDRDELYALLMKVDGSSPIGKKLRARLDDLERREQSLTDHLNAVKKLAVEARALGIAHPTIHAWSSYTGAPSGWAREEIERHPPRGDATYHRDDGPSTTAGWHQVATITNVDALIGMEGWLQRAIGERRAKAQPTR